MSRWPRPCASHGRAACACWRKARGPRSDGNLHPNALPRDRGQVDLAVEAQGELAGAAIRLGGSPICEHGIGRSPFKQRWLARLLGESAIAEMRAIRSALDPGALLAPTVLVPR